MQWVFPNLTNEQFTKAMSMAFWVFMITCFSLVAVILGLRTGAISTEIAVWTQQLIGPAVAINCVTLIFLADQNRKAAKENQ